ncbi:MAG: aminoacyl-histidine dipeptidase [Ruminococcus sp.]|nr:aminoacyl-histidine dipeptidase [Ruminococcus sp.]
MDNISNLRPEKVFDFFRQISEIPRGSGNTEKITQYCLDFAEQRNLRAVKDEGGNVIIYADGTEGYENSEPIIIQGHMDMVCEKTPDCTKDMQNEGVTLCTDGEYLWADGTTLGGDDGIAMAYIFALLDSDDIPHPPIEAVITRDEETGMFGAIDFDPELVKGRKMLNIDSEEEGILTVSCAGGITAVCEIPVDFTDAEKAFCYEISVNNLLGGHSGADIDKGRANAFKVMGEILGELKNNTDFLISGIKGGGKANVIPQYASVVIGTDSDCFSDIEKLLESFGEAFMEKYAGIEPDASFAVKQIDSVQRFCSIAAADKIVNFLNGAPNGVQSMSKSMEGLVQTSLNLGVLSLCEDKLCADFLIRSSSIEEKQSLCDKVISFVSEYGGTAFGDGDYPAWEYRENSPLRDLMVETYTDMYGKAPKVTGIHAGLECGIFSEKIKDADMVSFGPDNENIHTPAERMNIASVGRTWEYLKEILRRSR